MNPVEAGYRVLNEALLRTVFLFSGSPGNPAGSSSELFILHPHSKIWYWEINKSVLWLLFASFQEPPNTDKHKEQSTGISVQSLSLVRLYDPRELQHTRLPCPSSPRACSNLCPLSWWCHPTILSSVVPFSSCLQSFPASGLSNYCSSQVRRASVVNGNEKYWLNPKGREKLSHMNDQTLLILEYL